MILIAAGLRFPIAKNAPIGRDEAQTVALSRRAFPSGILDGLLHDGNAPAYYLVQHFFTAPPRARHRELKDRAPALLFGLLVIPLAWAVGRRLAGGEGPAAAVAGLCAAALMTVAPLQVEYATQVRMYSALSACALGLALLALRVLDEGGWRAWLGYAAVAAVALYVHSFAAWIVTGFALATFAIVIRRPGQIWRWVAAHSAAAVAFVPGLLFLHAQTQKVGGRLPWAVPAGFGAVKTHTIIALTGVPADKPNLLLRIAAAVSVVLVGFALWRARRRVGVAVAAVLLALVLAFGAAQITAAYEPRYNIGPLALAMVLVGTGVGLLATDRRLFAKAGAAGATVLLVIVQLRVINIHPKKQRSAARDAANLLMNHAGASDVVVTVPDSVAVSLNYYLPPGMTQLDVPDVHRVDAIDWENWNLRMADETLARQFDAAVKRAADEGHTLWVVEWKPLRGAMPRGLDLMELYRTAVPTQWSMARRAMSIIDRYYFQDGPAYKLVAADEPLFLAKFESRTREP